MVVFGKGVKFWGTDEKTKSNTINAFHPALKFYTLSFASVYCFLLVKRNGLFYWNCFLVAISFSFDFWGCLNVIMNGELWIINLVVLIMGGIFKKQCKHLPSALAAAQSKGIIFYLLIGIFWLLLWIAGAMISVQFTVFSVQHKFVSRRYGISYCESNYLSGFWQMKNDTLAGFFDFWGCRIVFRNQFLVFRFKLLWKCDASPKNNALTILVRRQKLRARVSFFYLLIGSFWLLLLIADATNSVQFTVFSLQHKLV